MTRSTVKKLVILVFAVVAFLTLEAFLVPWVVKDQLAKRSAELGVKATVERVVFNPFLWRLEIDRFDAAMADGPHLLSFDRAEVDLGFWSSLFHFAPALDGLALDAPRITLHRDDAGLHWLDLALEDEAQPSQPEGAAEPVNLYLARIEVSDGRVDYNEPVHPTNYQTALDDLDFVLTDLDTSIDQPGTVGFDIQPEGGGEIRFSSELVANPFQWNGTLELAGVQLAPHWRYVEHSQPIDVAGTIDATVPWRLGISDDGFDLAVSDARLAATAFSATWLDSGDEFLGFESLAVGPVAFNLIDATANLGQIELSGMVGRIRQADRDRLARLGASESDPESEEDGDSAFAVRVPEVRVVDSRIEVSDESLQPAFRATLGIDQAALSGFDSADPQALPLSLGGSVNEASLSVEGTLAWAEGALGADISLDGFQLADLDPIIRSLVPLSITGGALTAQVNLDTAQGQARGGASIEALAAEWLEPQHQVVEGAAIEIQEVVAALDPPAVRIAGIGLSGAEMLVRRFEDGSTIFSRLAAGGEASDETAAEESAEDPVALVIDEIRLEGQTVRFEDLAISPNYRTVLSDLSGTVSDVGTENLTVELTTNIDGQAPLQINGRIGEDLQIDVSANNIAMSPVSPYSGKFVGYRIERGKLKTDLNYQLTGTRLRGSNNLVLDDFELGETVASEDAVSVPLKLGLALLRDLDGKIRLDIPVSGDVSDPSFSVGGVILKAFANVFVKLAASPFKILGALVPGGGEDLQVVEFMPGRTAPVADETDALAQLAEALTRRPALRLDVSGVAVRALDGPALQRERLRARLEAADEADYRQKVTDAWLERFLPPATEPPVEDEPDAPSEPALPTFEEMEAPLLAEIDISNETLRALADERAQNIVAAFSSKPDLAERVFRLAPTVLESGEGDTIEVELAVDAR